MDRQNIYEIEFHGRVPILFHKYCNTGTTYYDITAFCAYHDNEYLELLKTDQIIQQLESQFDENLPDFPS